MTSSPRVGATWRILTWNVLGAKDPNLTVVAEVIHGYDADVVALQEVRRNQARALAKRLQFQVCWARKHYPYTPLLWWRAEGLAILSPHPLSSIVKATISPGVSTWTYRHRVMVAATARRGDDSLRLYDTHLASHDADERIAQAARIALRIEGDTGSPVVLAGDLNVKDDAIEVIREFTGLSDPGGVFTNPSIAPNQRLDYVLVPPNAEVLDRATPDGGDQWHALSDHLPVLLEIRL